MAAVLEPVALLSGGTLTYVTLFKVVSSCLQHLVPVTTKRYEISLRVVSAISAISAVSIGLLTMAHTKEDIVFKRYLHLDRFIWFWLPYFYYDAWAMYQAFTTKPENIQNKKTFMQRFTAYIMTDPLMMVHHMILPPLYGSALLFFRNGKGDYLIGMAFLMETTIPFISIRYILVCLGRKETKLYIFNGIMLMVSFGLARVALWFFMVKAYAIYRGASTFEALFMLPRVCVCFTSVFFAMNLFWFSGIVIKVYKSLKEIFRQKRLKQ